MRRITSIAMATVAIAGSIFVVNQAGAQSSCAPAARISIDPASYGEDVLTRTVTLHGRDVALREALDRLAAAAHVRFSYSADLLDLSRPVCLEYQSASARQVLRDLLSGAPVKPVIVGTDQVVLTPYVQNTFAQAAPQQMQRIGLLDRVVVTGSTVGASQRALPIALDVVSGSQLSQRGASTLSGALDGMVPGLWLWEQSPLSMLARYGSIRGASSFGVSYPKVYVDGIEVANSLLVTHLDPQSVARVEVIRGPQGAALYGADAISGVMNIITRQDGTEGGAPRAELHTEAGGASSDYRSGTAFAQSHAISLRAGNGIRSARFGMTLSSIGAYIPDAWSQQLSANGGFRLVRSRGVVTGTMRFFAQNARTPSSPLLSGIDFGATTASQALREAMLHQEYGPGGGPPPPDSVTRHRLDSLSKLVVLDSSDRQTVRQFTVGASGTFAQSDRWTHSAVAGLDGYRLRSASILDGAFPSALDSALRAATGNAVRTTLRVSSVGQFGNLEKTAATVTLAAEHSYVRDKTVTENQFRTEEMEGISRDELIETRTNAGFIGQVSASYKEAFFVNGGLRVERNTGLTGIGDIATLPMVGVSAVKSFGVASLKLRSAYGKGIRPPQTSSRAGLLMGLTGNLSPETQSGIEAGADLFVGSSLSLHVTRFDQTASGLIQPVSVYVPAQNDSIPRYRRIGYELQNVGQITNRGWELQAQTQRGPFSLGAMFSQVDSRVKHLAAGYSGDLTKGDRMLEVPARTLGVNAGYSQGRWSMSWRVSRASDWINYDRISLLTAFAAPNHDPRDFVGQKLRSYWMQYGGVTRVGGRLGFAFAKGMSLTLDGENLLDEQKGEPDNITVLPGRTISAGLGLRF